MSDLPSLDHVVALSDDVGILQHALFEIPNRKEGYCTDDVARAFMVAVAAGAHERYASEAARLGRIYLAFLADSQMSDGRFHNFMSYARTWLDDVGSEDSNGRAIWALGYGARYAVRLSWQEICRAAVDRAVANVLAFSYPRARAYAALGLSHAFEASGRGDRRLRETLHAVGEGLVRSHTAAAQKNWDWFEAGFTYDNARLPEALLRIGLVLEEPGFVQLALRTLDFYASIVIEGDTFVPIGNVGWYARGSRRARYAQQPLEASALVDAALVAEAVSHDSKYRRLAESGLAWYHGRNSRGIALAFEGGCYDGLEEYGVNRNMGAESTLAYVASAFAMARTEAATLSLAR